ncbi:hypothetical protein GF357_01210 [Candidatus Dojkabacteria bacterium]|nr:hypothetical protein [Candidatus Dojkabacteria bacterium]
MNKPTLPKDDTVTSKSQNDDVTSRLVTSQKDPDKISADQKARDLELLKKFDKDVEKARKTTVQAGQLGKDSNTNGNTKDFNQPRRDPQITEALQVANPFTPD